MKSGARNCFFLSQYADQPKHHTVKVQPFIDSPTFPVKSRAPASAAVGFTDKRCFTAAGGSKVNNKSAS